MRYSEVPRSVRWFEGLMYAAVSIDLFAFYYLGYGTSYLLVHGGWAAFLAFLVWSAARRRRMWALAALSCITAGGAILLTFGWPHGKHFTIAWVQTFTTVVAG